MSSSGEIVAVVVVTYHSERLLPDLVASFGRGMKGVSWHLTVADNASTDGTVDAVRRLAPTATVVEMGRNAGYAAGINAAVAVAGPHTAVLVLNPDVRLEPDCARELLAALRAPGTGIAVPRMEDDTGELSLSLRREPTVLRSLGEALLGARRAGRFDRFGELVTDPRRYETESVNDWAVGAAMMISAECWRRCGPWDESFFLYSEETEYALRARDAGLAVRYTPPARTVHIGGDSRRSPALWSMLVVNRVRLFRRRNGPVRTVGYWSVLVLRELSRAAMGRPTSRAALRALLSPGRLRQPVRA